MPKYSVTARVTITTNIEPEGYLEQQYSDAAVEDLDVDSFYGGDSEITDSTEIRFTFITDSDIDDAEGEAQDWVSNNIVYSGDDTEWEITDVNIDGIEALEMDFDRAKQVLIDFIRKYADDSANDELIAAITVVLDQIGVAA